MAVPLSLDRYGPPLSPTAKYLQERNIIEKESVRARFGDVVSAEQTKFKIKKWLGPDRKEKEGEPSTAGRG